jgi:hypothetical protein
METSYEEVHTLGRGCNSGYTACNLGDGTASDLGTGILRAVLTYVQLTYSDLVLPALLVVTNGALSVALHLKLERQLAVASARYDILGRVSIFAQKTRELVGSVEVKNDCLIKSGKGIVRTRQSALHQQSPLVQC